MRSKCYRCNYETWDEDLREHMSDPDNCIENLNQRVNGLEDVIRNVLQRLELANIPNTSMW